MEIMIEQMENLEKQMKEIENSKKNFDFDAEIQKDLEEISTFLKRKMEGKYLNIPKKTKNLELLEKKENEIQIYLQNFKFTNGEKSKYLKADGKERKEIDLLGKNLLKEINKET